MINVRPIKAFQDNYIWLVQGRNGQAAAVVVDPGDVTPVASFCEVEQVELAAILITHHHGDHTAGIQQLLKKFPQAQVFGPKNEHIAGLTHPVAEGEHAVIDASGLDFTVLDVPGHTKGHIAYYGHASLFCGDVMFSVGCGRIFEGTAQQMHTGLNKLAALDESTKVYCAHEYTLDNIGFAKWVEPENQALLAREIDVKSMLQRQAPTLPSTLLLEKQTNPFLRCLEPTVIKAAEKFAKKTLASSVDVFATLRYWKDSEYD